MPACVAKTSAPSKKEKHSWAEFYPHLRAEFLSRCIQVRSSVVKMPVCTVHCVHWGHFDSLLVQALLNSLFSKDFIFFSFDNDGV